MHPNGPETVSKLSHEKEGWAGGSNVGCQAHGSKCKETQIKKLI